MREREALFNEFLTELKARQKEEAREQEEKARSHMLVYLAIQCSPVVQCSTAGIHARKLRLMLHFMLHCSLVIHPLIHGKM